MMLTVPLLNNSVRWAVGYVSWAGKPSLGDGEQSNRSHPQFHGGARTHSHSGPLIPEVEVYIAHIKIIISMDPLSSPVG